MASLALELSIDNAANAEAIAIRKAPKHVGMTKQKARGRQKLLNRNDKREFEQLFSDAIVVKREIIAA